MLLNAYYDPQFSDHSHGFRPKRGCHTALREIYHTWTGTTWFIEGDISQCFDHLDHELLIKALEESIHDGRFIRLMRKLLDAGYMEDWTFNQTLSGVPQGGIISPLLSNILLDKLDKFVETTLIPQSTRGKKRKLNLEYMRLLSASSRQRKRGNVDKAEELRDKAQKLPALQTDDPDYRRLRYVRYADDFLLGFVGPKSEAEEIKQRLRQFLREELKLELSEEKTLVTHAKSEAARFLGYDVTTLHSDARRTKRSTGKSGTEAMCRSINGRIGLRVPEDILKAKSERYMGGGKAIHRKELLEVSDYTIIVSYQLEYRGIANYYRLAYSRRSGAATCHRSGGARATVAGVGAGPRCGDPIEGLQRRRSAGVRRGGGSRGADRRARRSRDRGAAYRAGRGRHRQGHCQCVARRHRRDQRS
jgi:group II intron reverse transcriptase/maturase